MNTLTPEYIRTLQEENKTNISEIVDTIMEDYINNLVCNGKTYVSMSKILSQQITYEVFRNELHFRGFYVSYDSGRYNEDSCAVVSLPPSGE